MREQTICPGRDRNYLLTSYVWRGTLPSCLPVRGRGTLYDELLRDRTVRGKSILPVTNQLGRIIHVPMLGRRLRSQASLAPVPSILRIV